MKTLRLVSTIAVLCFLATACGPKLLAPYKKIEPLPEGKGIIYIYHDPLSFTPYAYTVKLNGKDLVSLKPGAYYPLVIGPGEVELSARLETAASLTLDVKPGQAYYVQFFLTRGILINRPNLIVQSPQTGEIAIRECREAPPVSN